METFSALLAICAGNSLVNGEFPAQRLVTQSFDVFFYLRPNERLSKQSWAGDLRRHCALYDVTAKKTATVSELGEGLAWDVLDSFFPSLYLC